MLLGQVSRGCGMSLYIQRGPKNTTKLHKYIDRVQKIGTKLFDMR